MTLDSSAEVYSVGRIDSWEVKILKISRRGTDVRRRAPLLFLRHDHCERVSMCTSQRAFYTLDSL